MIKFKLVFCLILLSTFKLSAQVTTEGRDFWLGFMDNDLAEFVEIYISSRNQASVNVNAPLGGYSTDLTVAPNTTVKVTVPLWFMPETEGVHNLGLHVTSDNDVTVYSLNKRIWSADAAVILPTKALGQEYYVMAHAEPVGDRYTGSLESEMLIVATQDSTEIEVTPSVNTFNGLGAGITQNILLHAGQTYQLKSNDDLSGTHVRVISEDDANSCEKVKIAVYGGNKFTNVGGCGGFRDHLIEQMFPVSTWGKEFMFVPYETRIGGDYLKILAAEDNTVINISGEAPITLNKGGIYVNKALDGVRSIKSDKPIHAAQLSRSTECDGVSSDPFMIMLSPMEQRVQQVTFNTFTVDEIDQYYLTIITTQSSLQNIVLDGVDLTAQFKSFDGHAYLGLEVSVGTHTISAPQGVIVYVYGYGKDESFGYSAGISLNELSLDIVAEDEEIGPLEDQGCVDSGILFDALFFSAVENDSIFDTFEWDFGDGTLATGRQIVHSFSAPGFYSVNLIASKDDGACSRRSETTKEFEILDKAPGEPIGPLSVCPDVPEIEYWVVSPEANKTYEWTVDGGVVVGDNTGTSVKINWGKPNDNASVTLITRNSIGCTSDPVQLNVKVNKLLEPPTPQGNLEICFADIGAVTYTTPPINGSTFEWFVTNGTILGNNGQSTVDVQWSGAGIGEIWYRESNPSISDCSGVSESISVTVYPELIATETISHVLCNGESNGEISLNIVGGKGDYSVQWDSGMQGSQIAGLPIGTYTATITDELGCQITRSYIVEQPETLELLNHAITHVKCAPDASGQILVEMRGGVLPYTYHFSSNALNLTSTTALTEGLVAGNYDGEVIDANGCRVAFNFTINQPDLLEADLEALVNAPICPQASNGIVSIDAIGGTPAYQFFWNTEPQQTGREASGLVIGNYTVTIIDANGCEATLSMEVVERFPRLFIPTAFSPNNDGQNDMFYALTDCSIVFGMQIFNKWGTMVFSTKDITVGWDGKYQGENVPDGTYSYKVFSSGLINDKPFEETIMGTVRIFR